MGAYWRFHKLIAPADDPLGVEMAVNEVIAPGLQSPVMVVGRIMTLDHAQHIVASGAAQMVSMVRGAHRGPQSGQQSTAPGGGAHSPPASAPTWAASAKLMTHGRMSCVVNHTAAKEDQLSFDPEDRVAQPKRIFVVGGGPAGLEFARTAALRGHEVELHEAAQRLGGQVAIAASAPHRADLGGHRELVGGRTGCARCARSSQFAH